MTLSIIAVLFSAILHPIVGVYLKKAANPLTLNFLGVTLAGLFFSYEFWDMGFWQRVLENKELLIVSGLAHVSYVVISYQLIAKHEFQVLYPLTRLAPILVLIGEIFWFATEYALIQIFGVVMVVVGSIVLGLDKKISHVRWSVLFQVFLIALLVALFHLTDKQLLKTFSVSEMWALIVFQAPLLIPAIISKKQALKQDLKNWQTLLKYTISMIGTWYLALLALSHLDAAVVSSIRNLSILFGVFLGAHIFNEGHKWLRYLAAVFICLGAFFVLQ